MKRKVKSKSLAKFEVKSFKYPKEDDSNYEEYKISNNNNNKKKNK